MYKEPSILLTRDNFGCGSSREHAVWAIMDYGIKAVIAKSFERIHRSNLIGMGIMPIEINYDNIKITGKELVKFNLNKIEVKKNIDIYFDNMKVQGILRIDSEIEKKYYKMGGILNYVLSRN